MDESLRLLREQFPLLSAENTDSGLIYLDNASTTLKPFQVVNKITEYYKEYPVNVHRGAHHLAERATSEFEQARHLVKSFINAKQPQEIIFTKGTTESINLVANSFGATFVNPGDEIILTEMEHHANIVPWKMLCDRSGAKLKVIRISPSGELDLDQFETLLSPRTRMVGVVYVSNALGTINAVKRIIDSAHAVGAKVLVDAAQAVAHFPIDVQALDADFLCFSGHKMFGPVGVGIMYGKRHLLEQMCPYQGGGGMISNVSFESISYAPVPQKFETGTPSIASVIALGEAIKFIRSIGFEKIMALESNLEQYMSQCFREHNTFKVLGGAQTRCPVFSFCMKGVHPHDINTFLDQKNIAIRSGHHCTQPIMDHYKIPASSRASLSFYNSTEEIDLFFNALHEVEEFFS